jgi:hypothetical protein
MAQYLQFIHRVPREAPPRRSAAHQARGRPGLQATAIFWRPERERRFPVVILVFHSDRDGDQEFGVWEDAHGWL